jgi:hypothetical protein
MELPVIIVPLPNKAGFSARFAAPIALTAEAATPEEARARLAALMKEKMQEGVELSPVSFASAGIPTPGGWLPDDELTEEWLQHMKEYRDKCDAEDRARLDPESQEGVEPS